MGSSQASPCHPPQPLFCCGLRHFRRFSYCQRGMDYPHQPLCVPAQLQRNPTTAFPADPGNINRRNRRGDRRQPAAHDSGTGCAFADLSLSVFPVAASPVRRLRDLYHVFVLCAFNLIGVRRRGDGTRSLNLIGSALPFFPFGFSGRMAAKKVHPSLFAS